MLCIVFALENSNEGWFLLCRLQLILTFSLISSASLIPLLGIEVPQSDRVSGFVCRLYFVRISPIGPEKKYSVEERLNVGYLIAPAFWKYPQETAVSL